MSLCAVAIISIFSLGPTTSAAPIFDDKKVMTVKIRDDYIEQAYSAYSNCVIHIVDLIGNQDLPSPPVPIIVDDFTREERRHGDVYDDQWDMLHDRTIVSAGGIKIQSSDCFVTLLVGEIYKMLFNSSKDHKWAEHLRGFLRQDLTLGFRTPSPARDKYLMSAPILLPESVIILYEAFDWSVGVSEEISLHLAQDIFTTLDHIPTIMIILVGILDSFNNLEKSIGIKTNSSAYFFCYYCGEYGATVLVEAESAIGSGKQLAFEFRDRVPWVTTTGISKHLGISLCPFTLSLRRGHPPPCTEEIKNLEALAFANINSTHIEYMLGGVVILPIPRIITDTKIVLSTEIFAQAQILEFAMITSDGTESTSPLIDFTPLLQPFEKFVWAAVFVTNIALAIFITGLDRYWANDCARPLFSSLCSLTRVMLLQPYIPALENHSGSRNVALQPLHRAVRHIWAVWLLSTVFLVNNYGSAFSSNYIFEPTYTRDWTTLLDMENFTFFAGSIKHPLSWLVRRQLTDGHYFYGSKCIRNFIGAWLATDPRCPCSFAKNYLKSKLTSSQDPQVITHSMQNSVRIVHMDHIKQLIRTNLTAPKTVFISPLPFFDSDWQYFQEAMRSNKALRFTRNYNVEDTASLHVVAKYGFTAGLHPWHKDNIPRRLKTAVSSGILGQWRKWKAMRIKFHEGRRMTQLDLDDSLYLPLSLNGSDVYLAFLLFLVCLCVSSMAFASEMGSSCVTGTAKIVWRRGRASKCVFHHCIILFVAQSLNCMSKLKR